VIRVTKTSDRGKKQGPVECHDRILEHYGQTELPEKNSGEPVALTAEQATLRRSSGKERLKQEEKNSAVEPAESKREAKRLKRSWTVKTMRK